MEKLWSDSLNIGKLFLKNRVILSALTRVRCELDGIPTDLVAEYYAQRAGAGLLLTESASISQKGLGFPGQGNIFNKEQAEGWRKVIQGVHQKNAKIIIQIFHAGRVTHPTFNGDPETWAPSAVQSREKITSLGGIDYPLPKAVTKEDIETLKKEYDNAFSLAKEAGFDGVQLHGAFGYLIDQFLRSYTNRRTDEYGGSAENRTRFPLEVIDIALKHFDPSQVGIKLSPISRIQDMFDENPVQTYGYLLKELSKRGIGFVELAESAGENSYGGRVYHIPPAEQMKEVCKTFRPYFNGLIIGNYGFNPESGLKAIREGHCDAVSFGKLYIAHPDLAERIIGGLQLDNKLDFTTLYYNKEKGRAAGYTDYPFYKAK